MGSTLAKQDVELARKSSHVILITLSWRLRFFPSIHILDQTLQGLNATGAIVAVQSTRVSILTTSLHAPLPM